MKFLRNFVWNLIEDQVWDAISEFDEDLDAALFGDEECGIESAIGSLVKQEIRKADIQRLNRRLTTKIEATLQNGSLTVGDDGVEWEDD
jgi:hypothetical protein